jgi:hypothetical protein
MGRGRVGAPGVWKPTHCRGDEAIPEPLRNDSGNGGRDPLRRSSVGASPTAARSVKALGTDAPGGGRRAHLGLHGSLDTGVAGGPGGGPDGRPGAGRGLGKAAVPRARPGCPGRTAPDPSRRPGRRPTPADLRRVAHPAQPAAGRDRAGPGPATSPEPPRLEGHGPDRPTG